MSKYSKESLEKLLLLIDEICNEEENLWFKNKIKDKYSISNDINQSDSIEKIYEYCIKEIVSRQANKFYDDFKLIEIKEKLIEDFIRMEHFRRIDNFEDFCLAMFQQLEAIINYLSTTEVQNFIVNNYSTPFYKSKNNTTYRFEEKPLWQLIFYQELDHEKLEEKLRREIIDWSFSEKFKSVLMYYYFNKLIYNKYLFDSVFYLGNELYQSRNLNHRGGKVTEKQKEIILKVTNNSNKYYFKFLGFLEDFISTINKNV